MPVVARIRNLDRLRTVLGLGDQILSTIRFQLVIEGPAAAYAMVWEWGRSDCKPGPKTLWGTNPDGEMRVMTRTAPSGFVRINMDKYRRFVREEFGRVNWSRVKTSGFERMVEAVLKNAALRCADLIADTAPVDTGELRAAIRASKITLTGVEPVDQFSARTRLRARPGPDKWYASNRYLRQHVQVFNPQGVKSLESYMRERGK